VANFILIGFELMYTLQNKRGFPEHSTSLRRQLITSDLLVNSPSEIIKWS